MASAEEFEQYYTSIYKSRWSQLRKSLLDEKTHIARKTGKCESNHFSKDISSPWHRCYDLSDDLVRSIYENNPGEYYAMDLASVIAADQLKLNSNSHVWDACAAPGGKTLILLEKIDENGSLTATDLSRTRCERLKRVIQAHSANGLEDHIRVFTADAVNWGYRNQNSYDAVLIDVPCSSERHVINDQKALNEWSPNRVKTLIKRQYAILCSAVLSAKSEGTILYSTCSINPVENDGVIERYLQKKGNIKIQTLDLDIGSPTNYGRMIMPDTDKGIGPMYMSLIRKI